MKVVCDVSKDNLFSLITSAFEGGSNYWYMIERVEEPEDWNFTIDMRPGPTLHWAGEYALNPGGAVIITSQEDPKFGERKLTLRTIKKGLQVMADRFPGHLVSILDDKADGITGDVFLQCCLFGDIIYG